MTQLPALLTAAQVAEMLCASTYSVHRWAREGTLPFVELPSGGRRYRREDVEKILSGARTSKAGVA